MTLRIRLPFLPAALALALAAGGAAGCGSDAPEAGAASPDEGQTPPEEEQAFDLSELGFDRGSEEAPIQIIEFSDYGCVHCQAFHRDTYPALHDEFVEEGKVVWKYIPISIAGFPNADRAAQAGVCAGEQDRFFDLSSLVYREAEAWTEASDPVPVFTEVAEEAGLDLEAFEACMADDASLARVHENSQLATEIGVRGTPTFVVNGMPVQGAPSLEAFRDALNQMVEEIEAATG